MTTDSLSVSRVSKSFRNGKEDLQILYDINFSIPKGSTASIVGPSGSGKTTLLGLCAGLDRATEGQILLEGFNLSKATEEELSRIRSRWVGFVFQNFQLIPTLSACENVMVPLELIGASNIKKTALEWLSHVGLSHRINHFPNQLSGGEQQRVALARAFSHNPSIVFADEPTGNLDQETSESVEKLIFQLNKEMGTTLVLVTHNPELAQRTQQIVLLKGGKQINP